MQAAAGKEGSLFHAQGWDRGQYRLGVGRIGGMRRSGPRRRAGHRMLCTPRPPASLLQDQGWVDEQGGLQPLGSHRQPPPGLAPVDMSPGLWLQVGPGFRPSVSRGSWSRPFPSLASVSLKTTIAALETGLQEQEDPATALHGLPQPEDRQAPGSGIQARSSAPKWSISCGPNAGLRPGFGGLCLSPSWPLSSGT